MRSGLILLLLIPSLYYAQTREWRMIVSGGFGNIKTHSYYYDYYNLKKPALLVKSKQLGDQYYSPFLGLLVGFKCKSDFIMSGGFNGGYHPQHKLIGVVSLMAGYAGNVNSKIQYSINAGPCITYAEKNRWWINPTSKDGLYTRYQYLFPFAPNFLFLNINILKQTHIGGVGFSLSAVPVLLYSAYEKGYGGYKPLLFFGVGYSPQIFKAKDEINPKIE